MKDPFTGKKFLIDGWQVNRNSISYVLAPYNKRAPYVIEKKEIRTLVEIEKFATHLSEKKWFVEKSFMTAVRELHGVDHLEFLKEKK